MAGNILNLILFVRDGKEHIHLAFLLTVQLSKVGKCSIPLESTFQNFSVVIDTIWNFSIGLKLKAYSTIINNATGNYCTISFTRMIE